MEKSFDSLSEAVNTEARTLNEEVAKWQESMLEKIEAAKQDHILLEIAKLNQRLDLVMTRLEAMTDPTAD